MNTKEKLDNLLKELNDENLTKKMTEILSDIKKLEDDKQWSEKISKNQSENNQILYHKNNDLATALLSLTKTIYFFQNNIGHEFAIKLLEKHYDKTWQDIIKNK